MLKKMKSEFRPKSIRDLSGLLGEMTAYVAGVEVALLEASKSNKAISAIKWEEISRSHGIHLGGVTPESLLLNHARMGILSVYGAFDSYIASLKKEYTEFFGRNWVQNNDETALQALRKNCPNRDLIESNIVSAGLDVIDYYRLIRNVVAHPRSTNTAKINEDYKKKKEAIGVIRKEFQSNLAPNMYEALSFDDIKLFARTVLFVSDFINEAYTPSISIVAKKIPEKYQFKNLTHDISRRKKSIISYLRMEYGAKEDYACKIANEFFGSLA